MTDARGVATAYTYNGRHLVTGISYQTSGLIAGQTADPVPGVTFEYDAAGNRKRMLSANDAAGRVTYTYDTLARLTAEERKLPGLPGSYTISYGYTLAGALKSVTAPSGGQVTYEHDKVGRLIGVTGSGYAQTQLIPWTPAEPGIQYRAWGAAKHLNYGNGLKLDLTYDARMRVTQQKLAPAGVPAEWQVNHISDYEYFDDGSVKFISDSRDHRFDRSFSYDHVGRLTHALTGYQARGEQSGAPTPYKGTFQYDVWGNTTDRLTRHWGFEIGLNGRRVNGTWLSYGPITYQDNRRPGWGYDADGRTTSDGITHVYDAAGRQVSASNSSVQVTQAYDGDGRRIKRVETKTPPDSPPTTATLFEVRSSVLGGVVEELDAGGVRRINYLYSGPGALLAQGGPDGMSFVSRQAATGSEQFSGPNASNWSRTELDPFGGEIESIDPAELEDNPGRDFPLHLGSLRNAGSGCLMDGMPIPCTVAGEIADYQQRAGPQSVRVQITMAFSFIDRLRGRVDPLPGPDGRERPTGTALSSGTQVWVEDWRDWSGTTIDPVTGVVMPTAFTRDFGYFETLPQNSDPLRNVRIVRTGGTNSVFENNLDTVLDIMRHMADSKECNDAFRAKGLPTPREIMESGVTIGSSALLNDPSNNSKLGISEDLRKRYISPDYAGVTFPKAYSGRPTTLFTHRAFEQRGWSSTFSYGLEEVITHELIHGTQRVGEVKSKWKPWSHDLSGYSPYFTLVAACMPDRFKVKPVEIDLKR